MHLYYVCIAMVRHTYLHAHTYTNTHIYKASVMNTQTHRKSLNVFFNQPSFYDLKKKQHKNAHTYQQTFVFSVSSKNSLQYNDKCYVICVYIIGHIRRSKIFFLMLHSNRKGKKALHGLWQGLKSFKHNFSKIVLLKGSYCWV